MTLVAQNVEAVDDTIAAIRAEVPDFTRADLHLNVAHESAHYFDNAGSGHASDRAGVARAMERHRRLNAPRLHPVSFLEDRYQALVPRVPRDRVDRRCRAPPCPRPASSTRTGTCTRARSGESRSATSGTRTSISRRSGIANAGRRCACRSRTNSARTAGRRARRTRRFSSTSRRRSAPRRPHECLPGWHVRARSRSRSLDARTRAGSDGGWAWGTLCAGAAVTLTLELTAPDPNSGVATGQTFGRDGGTIGRDPGCSLVLAHPKVSGRHARIICQDGRFYIEDTSRNGISLNAPSNRLARGRQYPLSSGDLLLIDPYEISVSVSGDEGDFDPLEPRRPARHAVDERRRPPDPFAGGDPFGGEDPFAPPPEVRPVSLEDAGQEPAPARAGSARTAEPGSEGSARSQGAERRRSRIGVSSRRALPASRRNAEPPAGAAARRAHPAGLRPARPGRAPGVRAAIDRSASSRTGTGAAPSGTAASAATGRRP